MSGAKSPREVSKKGVVAQGLKIQDLKKIVYWKPCPILLHLQCRWRGPPCQQGNYEHAMIGNSNFSLSAGVSPCHPETLPHRHLHLPWGSWKAEHRPAECTCACLREQRQRNAGSKARSSKMFPFAHLPQPVWDLQASDSHACKVTLPFVHLGLIVSREFRKLMEIATHKQEASLSSMFWNLHRAYCPLLYSSIEKPTCSTLSKICKTP